MNRMMATATSMPTLTMGGTARRSSRVPTTKMTTTVPTTTANPPRCEPKSDEDAIAPVINASPPRYGVGVACFL